MPKSCFSNTYSPLQRGCYWLFALLLVSVAEISITTPLPGQVTDGFFSDSGSSTEQADAEAENDVGPSGVFPDSSVPGGNDGDGRTDASSAFAPLSESEQPAVEEVTMPPLDLLALLLKGRWLMLPIVVMLVVVVMLVFERALALRRSRVIPNALIEGLSDLGGVPGMLDPRRAYRMCQQYPSAAAVVIRAMLLKIGRPHAEVEHAVAEASSREAERLYGSARWLNLIAAVAPLTGLLGTVWGMIRAFYDTTHLPLGQNKAEYLAEGIYVALVTTLGGLVVAIPAAVFAHYFEGRVISLFHEIDELLFSLMPQVERYEGRVRVTPHSLGSAEEPTGERSSDRQVPGRSGSAETGSAGSAEVAREATSEQNAPAWSSGERPVHGESRKLDRLP